MTVCQWVDLTDHGYEDCQQKADKKASAKAKGLPIPTAQFCEFHLAVLTGKTPPVKEEK